MLAKSLSFILVLILAQSQNTDVEYQDDPAQAELAEDIGPEYPSARVSATYRNGMTWGYAGYTEVQQELVAVGCGGTPTIPPYAPYTGSSGGCNAYHGDTPCNHSLPILCINKLKYTRPCYPISCTAHAMPAEFYCGWSGGFIALSKPVYGYNLLSKANSDKICQNQFGPTFVMAEHHDGSWVAGMSDSAYCYNSWPTASAIGGGWSFYAYGVKGPAWTRFWTAIIGQSANCWDP